MTITVTMNQAVMGESGAVLAVGSTYSVGDDFGRALIGRGAAVDTFNRKAQPKNALNDSQVASVLSPRIAPKPANVLFRFDGSVAAAVGYTVTHTGTGGTAAIDSTTSPFTGRNAGASLKVNAAGTRTEVEITGMNIANWDGHVVVNCYVEDHTGTSLQLSVYAGTTAYSRSYLNTHTVVTGTGASPRNGMHSVPAGPMYNADVSALAQWTAGANSTFLPGADALNAVKIRINGDGVGTRTGAVWIHSITLVPKGRPTVVFTLDDCSASWIANVLPVFATNGIVGSFGINSGDLNGGALFLTTANLQAIAAAGHEIYSHNVANTALASPYGATEADTYAAAFKTGQAALGALVGDSRSSLYHPWVQGISSDTAVKRLRDHGMRVGRMATPSRHNVIAGAPGGGLFEQLMQLRSITTTTNGANQTQATLQQVLTDCERYGTTVVFMTHEVTDTATGIETSPAVFSWLCGAVAGNPAIAVRTVRQLYQEALDEGLTLT